MIALSRFVLAVLASPFKSKSRLEVENAVLRHQLIVLRRKLKGPARRTNNDRWFFVWMYRWFPTILKVVTIVQPETLVRWHRVGFRRYWRWKCNTIPSIAAMPHNPGNYAPLAPLLRRCRAMPILKPRQ